mmetsp:Transcript_43359/g.104793  ORF Transcript_43359/g.104793 Transcript_43359/m.104793 type:complete len:414 (+) Transcript_43359:1120-2361(+)
MPLWQSSESNRPLIKKLIRFVYFGRFIFCDDCEVMNVSFSCWMLSSHRRMTWLTFTICISFSNVSVLLCFATSDHHLCESINLIDTNIHLFTTDVDTDLYKLIMSPQYLTNEHIQTFLYQMLTGLKFLHSASVIHRDLKPANILLNENCSLKICDFGLARIVDASSMMSSSAKKGEGKQDRPPAFPKKSPLTRQLTKHVVTRWYRAPELILIQPYTSAVDIWSLGCIMAELLSMQEGNVPGYQDRTPLFPGGSCYPLSGETASVNDERLDQLSVIFGVIGTPSEEEIAALGKANEYIKTLEFKKPKKLEELYPASDPIALDLLQQMLKFNPKNRCTADEALEHKFFQGVRQTELEKVAAEALEVPEFLNSTDIDLNSLKRKTFEEVIWYRDHQDQIDPKATTDDAQETAAAGS